VSTEAPDDYDAHIKQQILTAFGFASEAELDAAIEEELPGYLAAHAAWEAEKAAFIAELADRAAEATAAVTAWGQAHGMLSDGVELVPMDLQADAEWMAPAPQNLMARAPEPPDTRPRIWFDGREITVNSIEFDTVPAEGPPWRAIQMASDFQRESAVLARAGGLGGTVIELSTFVENFTAAMRRAHEAAVLLTSALGTKPCVFGAGPCFCHPKPFPAARDYRRRTKHRNRRRKL
jgi:hypothetical protein